MSIAFIGGGNMATALITGLLKNGWRASDIGVVDIDATARERLTHDLGVSAAATVDAAKDVDCVVIAVKPQHVRDAARDLGPLVGNALVITIAAGIRYGDLSRWLGGHARIVRAMPNTPALAL